MDQDDGGSFPVPWVLVSVGVTFAIIAIAVAVLTWNEANEPPIARYYGCYAAYGGPDIAIDKITLTVLQAEPIKISSKLEYEEGWKFGIDRWLEVRVRKDRFEVVPIGTGGEYLNLSYGEQATGPVPQFTLYDPDQKLSVTYRRIADHCS